MTNDDKIKKYKLNKFLKVIYIILLLATLVLEVIAFLDMLHVTNNILGKFGYLYGFIPYGIVYVISYFNER